MDFIKTVLIAIISGGVGAAIVKLIGDGIAWRRNRKAAKEDRAEDRKEEAERRAAKNLEERMGRLEAQNNAQSKSLNALSEALKFMLYDRIRYLGQAYIAAGEIDFDDRRVLNDMHRSYHNGLGGNGDLDTLMAEVNSLKLKTK